MYKQQEEPIMVDKPKEEINALVDNISAYVQTTVELNKLRIGSKAAQFGARTIHGAIGIVLLLLVLLSLNMALGFLLGEWLGKVHLGFFVLTGIYLLIAVIFYLNRKNAQSKLTDNIIKEMFK